MCLRIRRRSPRKRKRFSTAPARVRKPAGQFCNEPWPCVFPTSRSSEVDWRLGKRTATRSSPTKRSFTSKTEAWLRVQDEASTILTVAPEAHLRHHGHGADYEEGRRFRG